MRVTISTMNKSPKISQVEEFFQYKIQIIPFYKISNAKCKRHIFWGGLHFSYQVVMKVNSIPGKYAYLT